MINTVTKNENNSIISIDKLLQDVYSLSKWEKIKELSISEHEFLFADKVINAALYRKFSVKNNIEKYMLKDFNDKILADIDLKIYKDSVYIINLEVLSNKLYEKIILLLLQIAVEKSLYNTTENNVFISLTGNFFKNYKIKKIILANGFFAAGTQSDYEKNLFGEEFKLKVSDSPLWLNKIKQIHLLLNK